MRGKRVERAIRALILLSFASLAGCVAYPGMMGGGYGMRGGYGYDAGMMGGSPYYGYGPGAMSPYGYGPGMQGGYGTAEEWGFGPVERLNLSNDQRQQVGRVEQDLWREHWNLQGRILDEEARLRELYGSGHPDPAQVGQVWSRIGDLHRQMGEAHARAFDQIQDVLTPAQRQQLSEWQRGGGAAWGRGPASAGGR